MYGKYGNYMYGIHVWNFGMDYLLGNYLNSFFVYVWVRKTLTLHKGVFGWSKFSFEG